MISSSMIDLLTGCVRRLDDEDVVLAHVVPDPDEDVLVGELEHVGLAGLACRGSAQILRASSGLALPW